MYDEPVAFERMFRAAQAKADAAGDIDWLLSVDSTIVRAHHHAAGARKGGRRALGRSRGGLTSKIHLPCDAFGRPLAFVVTGGNTHDRTQFTAVVEAIRVPRIGPERPWTRPSQVIGDKGYSSKAIRPRLRRRGIDHMNESRQGRSRTGQRRVRSAIGTPSRAAPCTVRPVCLPTRCPRAPRS
ncbi:IS5 family transposase [Streptomyces sp. NPDC000941]